MPERALVDALDDCIDRLAMGQTVEECLAAYPHLAPALRPMLEAGRLAYRARVAPQEIMAAQARVRAGLQREVRRVSPRRVYTARLTLRLAAGLLIVFACLFGGASVYSQTSLPGQPLYGLKRLTENMQLDLAADDATLRDEFARRRREEIAELLAQGRSADVEFEGRVQSILGEHWQIEDLAVRVAAGTPGASGAQPGDQVRVEARTTADRELIASRIQVISRHAPPTPALPTNTPEPSSTPSPTPKVTSTATPSATPTVTATPSPTPTATPSPSPTPSRTPAPTIPPTRPAGVTPPPGPAPTDDDGGDDHGGDNGDDHGGSDNSGSGGGGSGSSGSGSGGNDDGGDDH